MLHYRSCCVIYLYCTVTHAVLSTCVVCCIIDTNSQCDIYLCCIIVNHADIYLCRLHCVIHLCCIILTLMLYYRSTYVIMPRMLRYLLACVVLFSLISHVALSVLLVTHAVISNWYSCMLCAIPLCV